MGEEDSVETLDDFAQALVDDGTLASLMDDSAPGAESADTGSAVEQPRDEQGRFVAAEREEPQGGGSTEDAVPQDAEPTEEVEQGESAEEADDGDLVIEIDADLEAVLARYDGDVGKALRALGDKESMVGRQANDIGQLRAELAQQRQLLEQGFARQPQYFGPYQSDLEDDPKGLVAEALERGDQRTAELALRAWGEEEPFEAAAFLLSLQQQTQASPQEQPTPAPEADGTLEGAMAAVVERHPDVEKYLPGIGETAKEFPTLRGFLEQGTSAQKAQAFEELLVITKTRASQSDTSQAMKKVILKTQEEVRKEKADAAVVSAQTQTAATAQKSALDDFLGAFDEAAERYSPSDWITKSNE